MIFYLRYNTILIFQTLRKSIFFGRHVRGCVFWPTAIWKKNLRDSNIVKWKRDDDLVWRSVCIKEEKERRVFFPRWIYAGRVFEGIAHALSSNNGIEKKLMLIREIVGSLGDNGMPTQKNMAFSHLNRPSGNLVSVLMILKFFYAFLWYIKVSENFLAVLR